MNSLVLVIPCYNEQYRFNSEYFNEILLNDSVSLIFVNDGSTDSTQQILEDFVSRKPERASLLNILRNGGKANAVRFGLLSASKTSADFVGYLDADGAFPTNVVKDGILEACKENNEISSYWFSRVKLAGSKIERNWARHYIGRVVVTFCTFGLDSCPYDTQAGFKIFQNNPVLAQIWDSPFISNWLFDIEIFIRLSYLGYKDSIKECPVREWRDISGSKIGWATSLVVLRDLIKVVRLKRFYLNVQTKNSPRAFNFGLRSL